MHDPPFVQVLGAVRFVGDDGGSVTLPSASQRRLLALLALGAGATLRSDFICELLGLSHGALRTTVSRLRRRLGEQIIVTDAVGYGIGCPVDAALFAETVVAHHAVDDRLSALDAALALWHGDVLDEFRHEAWAEADATRLDELRCLATEERFECLLRRGRSGEVVAELESYLATHPLRDRPWGLLMEALAEEGRRSEALRRYQEYRSLLEQTGLDPSETVRSIEQRIAAGQVATAHLETGHIGSGHVETGHIGTGHIGSGHTGTGRTGTGHDDGPEAERRTSTNRPGERTAVQVPLPGTVRLAARSIGRYRELATLAQELGLVRRGRLRAVALSGEAGIGKTTVLATFARSHQGRNGATVLYGRCEDGGAVPLQPLRSIVESIVEHAPTDLLRAHCERFGGELLRVAPQLATRLWVPPPLTADDAIERHQLFAAITDLLRRSTTTGPVVLLLDDLHWAEPTSLLLVRHLALELADAPVLLVVSYRDVSATMSEDLRTTLTALDCIDAVRLHLQGVEDGGLEAIATAAVGVAAPLADDVLGRLRDQTAGNPLYAAHLSRHLADIGVLAVEQDVLRLTAPLDDTGVPDSLVEVVRSRVLSLGPTAQAVLRSASVLGVEFDQRVLLGMCDLDDDELVAVLDAAVDAGLLVEGDRTTGSMRFTHALVARALSAEIGAPGRRRLHERAADALLTTDAQISSAEIGDELPVATVVALARHAAAAGDLAAAQHRATTAGDSFLDHLAPAEAATWYGTALDHAVALGRSTAVADLTARLGEARVRAGDPRADRTLLDAAGLARRCGAHDVLVRVALALDHAVMRLGGIEEEHLATVEAALRVADRVDPVAHARLLAVHAEFLFHTDRADERRRDAAAAVELLETVDDPAALPQMIPALTYALWGRGTVALRRDLTLRAVAAADELDDRMLQFWSRRSAYFAAVESADAELAASTMSRLRSIVDEVPEPRLRWMLGVLDTFEATMAGRLDDAQRHAGTSVAQGVRIGEPDALTVGARQLFVIRSFGGRHGELIPMLESLVADHPQSTQYRLGLAVANAADGRLDVARAVLDRGTSEGFAHVPVDHLWTTAMIGYSVLAVALSDGDAADELRGLLEPFAGEVAFNGTTSQGPISAYLGRLCSLLGDHEAAERHLRIALRTATDFGWGYHRAATSVALVQARLRRGGHLDSSCSTLLEDASELAARHRLAGIAAQLASMDLARPDVSTSDDGGMTPT